MFKRGLSLTLLVALTMVFFLLSMQSGFAATESPHAVTNASQTTEDAHNNTADKDTHVDEPMPEEHAGMDMETQPHNDPTEDDGHQSSNLKILR